MPSLGLLSALTVALSADSGTATSKTCRIAQSIYRDADGNGYELIFGPPAPPVYHSTAVIKHPQHGQIYRFLISQSSGYGTISLIDQGNENLKGDLTITFFDQQLKSATPLFWGDEPVAPQYATVANLGRHDHYKRRNDAVTPATVNRPAIGDVMWVFDRCQ